MRYVEYDSELTPENGGDAVIEEWDGERYHVQWWETLDHETVVVRYDDGLQHEVPRPFFYAAWRPWRHDGRCHCAWALPGPRPCVCFCGRPTVPSTFIGPLRVNRWNNSN